MGVKKEVIRMLKESGNYDAFHDIFFNEALKLAKRYALSSQEAKEISQIKGFKEQFIAGLIIKHREFLKDIKILSNMNDR